MSAEGSREPAERAQNFYGPDGYRYGVMFNDGSVADYWNGRTQRERAETYRDEVLDEQRKWLAGTGRNPDNITLARQAPGRTWERLSTSPAQSSSDGAR